MLSRSGPATLRRIPEFQTAVSPSTRTSRPLLRFAFLAALLALVGVLFCLTPLGEPWQHASYDYLFRFGARTVTNPVEVILMDNAAFDTFHQERGQPWDRALHAKLLNKLADDGCALVVMDSFFRLPRDAATDAALAAALRRLPVVLMAEQAAVTHNAFDGARPSLPAEPFLGAASNRWGVAWLDPDLDLVVRRHWPFPAPGPYPSLAWTAARLAGATREETPRQQWLRYYGERGPWHSLSYGFALAQPANYYRDKIVFVGLNPKTSMPGDETDEFRVPYTRWTNESKGGVQLMITAFLNLVNREWLERLPGWCELVLAIVSGAGLGAAAVYLRIRSACILALSVAGLVALVSIASSYYSNCWFPWLVISGAQAPLALAGALAMARVSKPGAAPAAQEKPPRTPGYKLIPPAFGQGAYGKVWLARDRSGNWFALKAVYLAHFGGDRGPYDREFNGVKRYQTLSGKHPGLLRVASVGEQTPAGYFY